MREVELEEMLDSKLGGILRRNARILWSAIVFLAVAAFSLGSWSYANQSKIERNELKVEKLDTALVNHVSDYNQSIKEDRQYQKKMELNILRVMDKLGVEPVSGLGE